MEIKHRDFFGAEINVGDYVIAAHRSNFSCCIVRKLTPKQVRVENVDFETHRTDLRYSADLVIMDPAAVTFRKLSRK